MTFKNLAVDAFLTDEERSVWHTYNNTAFVYPPEHSLINWLERVAQAHLSRPAIVAEDGALSYAELYYRADMVAKFLISQGVKPGKAVAIAAVKRCCTYVGLLGVLKTGCFYVPIDPHQPQDRLETIFQSAGVVAVLSDAASAEKLDKVRGDVQVRAVLEESTAPSMWHSWPLSEPHMAATVKQQRMELESNTWERICYIIYTSGTTGKPKGVCISEGNVINFVNWYIKRHAVELGDHLSQNAPLTFDPSVQQIFSAWVSGACLMVVPSLVRQDAHSFLQWLRKERITHLDIVTAHWVHLLGAVVQEPSKFELPNLRWIVVGGESIYYHQTHQWYQSVISQCRINSIYGPTEATINATEFEVDPIHKEGKVPIGTPLPNYRIYIFDDANELCPPGVVGEICIAGAGVALEYSSPEATKRAFTQIHFQEKSSEKIYHTGDLGKLIQLSSGEWVLEFKGRLDRQIKISGYRVELEEIEMLAERCPGVDDAVVLVKGSPAEQLICFFSGTEPNTEYLREYLSACLPSFMVPNILVSVDQMPMNKNGKVDSQRLLSLLDNRVGIACEDRDRFEIETERLIAEVWSRVIGTNNLTPNSEFFRAGGSSLLAFRAVMLLQRHGLDIRGSDMLRGATIRSLALTAQWRKQNNGNPLVNHPNDVQATSLRNDRNMHNFSFSWPRDRYAILEKLQAGVQSFVLNSQGKPEIGPLTKLWLSLQRATETGTALLDLQLPGAHRIEDVVKAVVELIQRYPLLRSQRIDSLTESSLCTLAVPQMDVTVIDLLGCSTDEVNHAISEIKKTINEICATWTGLAATVAVAIEPSTTYRILLGAPHLLLDGASLQRLALDITELLGITTRSDRQVDSDAIIHSLTQSSYSEGLNLNAIHKYLEKYIKAEEEVTHLLASELTNVEPTVVTSSWMVPERLVQLSIHDLTTVLATGLSQAMYQTFGLNAVAISKAHHGRDCIAHENIFDVVANLMDYHLLLVQPTSDIASTYLSARKATTLATMTPTRHWVALINQYFMQLIQTWPKNSLPLVGSVRLSLGSGIAEEIAPGVRVLNNPTEIIKANKTTVELLVRLQGDQWVADIVATKLGHKQVHAIAQACQWTVEQLLHNPNIELHKAGVCN
ncbi:MAG: non-ribosomal peptide synthetase [Nostoc sp. DedQUE05]|uniref:non-ribosomal peptide synthetase n=1 Tax=Nostoc sp. DedQUE05 TaxID=3075391 RepID=UPI002AD26E13|nr:non-ribosomal peptide synthetase [Nostoc sp. DedQUE05]MDZ8091510.1 non-ribosomal peptide synthetase [Nostoc sp. DedQUE05]